MNPSVAKYKKALNKHLRCTGKVKKRLLTKFDDALRLYLEENPSPDEMALQSAFGMPEDMAKILIEEVSPLENKRYQTRTVIHNVIIGLMIAIVVALAIYIFFIKQKPVVTYDTIYDDGIICSESTTQIQEGD